MSAMQRNPDAAVEELTQALALAQTDDARGESMILRFPKRICHLFLMF
jgi:hypothetical protein